jgi:hypothetical protein
MGMRAMARSIAKAAQAAAAQRTYADIRQTNKRDSRPAGLRRGKQQEDMTMEPTSKQQSFVGKVTRCGLVAVALTVLTVGGLMACADAADPARTSSVGTSTPASSSPTPSAEPETTATPVSIDAPSVPARDGLVITVDALKLQFTVPPALSDLTLAPIDWDPIGVSVGFSTRTLEAMGPPYCGAEHQSLGRLRLSSKLPESADSPMAELVADLPQGSVYYFQPSGPCAGDRTVIDFEGRQIDELRAALDTLAVTGD